MFLHRLVGSGLGATHPGIGMTGAPGSVGLVPNRSREPSLLVSVTGVFALGAPTNVTWPVFSRFLPTVTLGAVTPGGPTFAMMLLALPAGVLNPAGSVMEIVALPCPTAVNVVVKAVSAGVKFTVVGLTVPTELGTLE